MSSTAVATQQKEQEPVEQKWRDQIIAMEPQFKRALPSHIPVERFVRATETAIMRDAELINCDRRSLFQAVMQCAETGLMPNGREAALVRFKRNVTFIPMISGILRMMRNTGEIASIVAEVVCEGDKFDFELGSNPHIFHKPTLNERGDMIGAYASVKTKDGAEYLEVMGKQEIEKIRGISAGYKSAVKYNKTNSVWHIWPEEMARKTVMRRLAKKCPLSTDALMDLTSRDDHMYDLNAVEKPQSQTEQMRDKLRGVPSKEIESQAPEVEAEDISQDDQDAGAIETVQIDEAPPTEANDAIKEVTKPAETKLDAPFKDHSEALANMSGALPELSTVKDIDEFVGHWRAMIKASFDDSEITLLNGQGNTLVLKRKTELSPASKK